MFGKWYTNWKASRNRSLRGPMPDTTFFVDDPYPKGMSQQRYLSITQPNCFGLLDPPRKPAVDWSGTLFENTENQS